MAQPRDSWLTKNGKARRVSLDYQKKSQNHNRLDQRRLVNDSGLLGLDNARRVSTDRPSLDHISEDLCSKTKGSDPPKTHNCSSTDTLQPSQDSKHDVFAHIDWQAFDEQCANLVNDQSHKKCKLQNSEQVYAKAISDQEGIVSEENVNHQHETPSTIATILNNRKEGSPMASTTRTDTNGVIDVQDQSTKVKSPDFEKETKDVDLSELLEPVILTQQVSNQTVGSQGQSIVQDNSRNSEKYKHRTAGKRQSADTQGIDINHQTQKQRKVATAPLQESYIRPVSPKEVNKIAEVNKTNTRNQLEKYPPLDPIDEEENHSRDEAYYSQSMFPSQEDYGGIVLAFTQEIKESNTKWLAEEKEKAKNEVTDEDEEEEYESFPNDLTQDELDARFHSFARRPAEDLLWKELDGLVSPSTGAREWVYDSHNLADPERKRIYKVGQTWSSMKDPDWAYTIQGCIEKGCLTKKLLCTASRRITTTIFQGKWENGKNIWLEDSEPVIIDMKKLNWGPDLGFTKPPIIFAENIIKTRKSGYGCSFVWKGQAEKIPLKEKPKVIELFAGAGGMSLGLEKAGFDVTVLVENDINAYQCLEVRII